MLPESAFDLAVPRFLRAAFAPLVRTAPRLALLPMCLVLGLASSSAHAQTSTPTSTGIAADRFTPAPGPAAFGQVEGAKVAPAGQIWITGMASAVGHPLRLRSALTQEQVAEPVAYRVTLDLGAEVGVWRKRLALGLGVPVAVWQIGDRLRATGSADPSADGDSALATAAAGDIRLRGKALLTPPDRRAALALVFEVTIPGPVGASNFAATSGVTVAPRLVGWFHRGPIAAAANVELRLAPARTLYETTLHDSLEWGIAAAYELPARRVGLLLVTEATGQLNLVTDQYLSSTELRGLLRIAWWRGSLDLGGGGGFGPLTPAWRAFIGMRGFFGRRDPDQTGCAARPATL